MATRRIVLPLVSALSVSAACGNPLFNGADPHAMRIGADYWIFPTESGTREPIFAAYRSTDLREWKREQAILNLHDVPWVKWDDGNRNAPWAPAMAEKNGKFYFYYSVGPQSHERPSRIGVAVGDTPTGPFKDSGAPMLSGNDRFEAIDPMVFTDPAGGKSYFYAGGSAGSTLRVFEMKEDMIHFAKEIPVKQPPHFTEGAFMHLRNGIYYLSYSHGRWNDPSYSVHYCTAPSPTGPWQYRGAILESDATHQGPGHHSFVEDAKTNEWFIVYHRWDTSDKAGPFHGARKIAIERISYDSQGLISPIRMTDGGK